MIAATVTPTVEARPTAVAAASTVPSPPAPEPPPAPIAAAAPIVAEVAQAAPLAEVADAAPTLDPDAARREKRAAQRALEMGRAAAAIESGEKSVSLDPSDGEAWLVLGAAYLERGQATDARRCFRACMTEASRGPKWECGAMLR